MEIDKDLWLTPKHTARETLKILPILDNGYHEIPSSVSEGEAFVPSWLLLFLPGSSFPQLHHLKERFMVGMIPDQDMLEEMRNGCWAPWTVSQAWNNSPRTQESFLIFVHLRRTWFSPHSKWTMNFFQTYTKKHIFLSCEIFFLSSKKCLWAPILRAFSPGPHHLQSFLCESRPCHTLA